MHPWLRRLFACLLALALPVQGMAGVARMHCASAPGPAAVAAAAHADHGHHDHGAHHGHAVGDAATSAAPADDGGASPSSGAHKCSACAACALGAALPPAHTAMPQPEPEAAAWRGAPLPAMSFIAGGPERPPRSTHA